MHLAQDARLGYGLLMNKDTGRLQMRLTSKRALVQYMRQCKTTNAELARAAGCSESSVAFLRSTGRSSRTTIGFAAAKRIEEALGAPSEILFVPELVVASESVKQMRQPARRLVGAR